MVLFLHASQVHSSVTDSTLPAARVVAALVGTGSKRDPSDTLSFNYASMLPSLMRLVNSFPGVPRVRPQVINNSATWLVM